MNIIVSDEIYNGYDFNNMESRTFPILYYAKSVTELYESLLTIENVALSKLFYTDVWKQYNSIEDYTSTYLSMSYYDTILQKHKSFTTQVQDIWCIQYNDLTKEFCENLIKNVLLITECENVDILKTKLETKQYADNLKNTLIDYRLSENNAINLINIIINK